MVWGFGSGLTGDRAVFAGGAGDMTPVLRAQRQIVSDARDVRATPKEIRNRIE